MENIKEKASIEFIVKELEQLSNHIKNYSKGAYSAYYLQLNSALKIQDIVKMMLNDVYWYDEGYIKVKTEFTFNDMTIYLDEPSRKELAWYAFQRIPVRNTRKEVLNDYLCVNKQGKMLNNQVYRKMLERSSKELNLSRVYNPGYLRSLYGYLKIAHGVETVEAVAKEYGVDKYYLLSRTFRGLKIQYAEDVFNAVAGII